MKHKIWAAKDSVLLYDSDPTHHLLFVQQQQQVTKHDTVVLPHPPYSPDLRLCNFYFFLQVEDWLKDELQGYSRGSSNLKDGNAIYHT
jgi:hypothetical protein